MLLTRSISYLSYLSYWVGKYDRWNRYDSYSAKSWTPFFTATPSMIPMCPSSYKMGHRIDLSYGGSGSSVGLIMQPAFDVASGVVGSSVFWSFPFLWQCLWHAHSLRHTFRDRLRASGCPLELIDQIGGWSSIGTIGSKYGQGYDLDAIREQLIGICIEDWRVLSAFIP